MQKKWMHYPFDTQASKYTNQQMASFSNAFRPRPFFSIWSIYFLCVCMYVYVCARMSMQLLPCVYALAARLQHGLAMKVFSLVMLLCCCVCTVRAFTSLRVVQCMHPFCYLYVAGGGMLWEKRKVNKTDTFCFVVSDNLNGDLFFCFCLVPFCV